MVCETDGRGGEARQIVLLTYNLFSWPKHAVLSSRPTRHYFCFSAKPAQPEPLYGPQAPAGTLAVTASWLWLGLHWLQLSQLNAAQLKAEAFNGAISLTSYWLSFWPSLPSTGSTGADICIYYFITPTYFRLDHMISFHLFTQVRLWLTARSRVNM